MDPAMERQPPLINFSGEPGAYVLISNNLPHGGFGLRGTVAQEGPEETASALLELYSPYVLEGPFSEVRLETV